MALIAKTNEYTRQVTPEIALVHKRLRDAYLPRFAELESIVTVPLDFARAVKVIGNSLDTSNVTE